MQIIVQVKSQYGQEVVHPVCQKAKAFAAIAGTRTLTEATIRQIKALGYSIALASRPNPSFLLSEDTNA